VNGDQPDTAAERREKAEAENEAADEMKELRIEDGGGEETAA